MISMICLSFRISRFCRLASQGESMPLILIQSILASVPVISTDVGQIKDMLESETGQVGVTIEVAQDDEVFIAALLDELRKAINGDHSFSADSFEVLAKRFSIETCVDKYEKLYAIRGNRSTISCSVKSKTFQDFCL